MVSVHVRLANCSPVGGCARLVSDNDFLSWPVFSRNGAGFSPLAVRVFSTLTIIGRSIVVMSSYGQGFVKPMLLPPRFGCVEKFDPKLVTKAATIVEQLKLSRGEGLLCILLLAPPPPPERQE